MTQMHDHGDIWIGDLPLNYTDEEGCRWIVEEVDGWWGLPPAVIPEDERPYNEDGNYWTSGRYGPRTIQITGVVVPPRASEAEMQRVIASARDRLSHEISLVRRRGRLTFHEVGASKSIDVQLLGLPLINTATQSNVLHFDLQFVAQDPRKYSTIPQVATASLMNSVIGGREYPKTFNFRYGEETGTNQAHVINIGDTQTHSSIRITGPVIDPQIIHQESGAFIKVNLTLGAADYLDIDLHRKTVILNGTESRLAKLDFDSTWFSLSPGDNTLRFDGIQTTPPQEGWAAATNRVTNPSAERAGSAQTIHQNLLADPSITTLGVMPTTTRTNMAVNPTFEPTFTEEVENLVQNPRGRATDGTVTIRENLVRNPNFEYDNGFEPWATAGTAALSLETDNPLSGTQSLRIERTGDTGSSYATRTAQMPEVGLSLRTRAQVRANYTGVVRVLLGTVSDYSSFDFAVEAGVERTIEAEYPTAEGMSSDWRLWIGQGAGMGDVGDVVVVDQVLLTYGDEMTDYFDGDTSPDPDLTPEWTGTPGYSTSRLVAPTPAGWTLNANALSYYSQTRDAIALSGLTPAGIYTTPDYTPGDSPTTLIVPVETSDGQPVTMTVYRAGSVVVQTISSGEELRIVSTRTDSAVTAVQIREDTLDRTVYFRLAAVPGEYSGPYFDGHSENIDPDEHAWTGEEDASTSTRKTRALTGAVAGPGTEIFSSMGWASSGQYSLRIVPATQSTETYADITPAGVAHLRGRQITLSGAVHVAALDSAEDVDAPNQAALVLRYLSEDEIVDVRSSPIGNSRVAVSARIPESASNIQILAYNGQGLPEEDLSVTEDLSVYWDDILISSGGVKPDFFDQNSEEPGATYLVVGDEVHEEKCISPAWSATVDAALYSGPEFDPGLTLEFFGTATVSTPAPEGLDSAAETLTIGTTIQNGPDLVLASLVLISEDPEILDLPAGESIEIAPDETQYISAVLPKPEEGYRVGVRLTQRLEDTDPQIASVLNILNMLVADGEYSREYFDGDTPVPDMSVSWSGTTAIATAPAVPGYTASDSAHVYQSSLWASSGAKSLAILRKDTADPEEPTYAEISVPSWDSLPAGVYTLVATVNAEDGDYLSTSDTRTLEVVDESSGFVFRSAQAPVGVPTRLSVVFEKTGPAGTIRLISNALGPVTVRWDGIMIVAGEYTDRYFDGTRPGASWSGTAHNSTSTQTARQKIPAAMLSAEYRHSWLR